MANTHDPDPFKMQPRFPKLAKLVDQCTPRVTGVPAFLPASVIERETGLDRSSVPSLRTLVWRATGAGVMPPLVKISTTEYRGEPALRLTRMRPPARKAA